MAYFENLAADLDCVQGDVDLPSLVKHNREDPTMPFALAKEIGQVIKWNFRTNVPAKTTYINTIRKWADGGVDFYPGTMHCCADAELYIIDSIRTNLGKACIDPINFCLTERQPAVIFTVRGTAVGYKKSFGADSTYGLRDSVRHNLWAGMLSAHDFDDTGLTGTPGDVLVRELGENDSFTALRPTAFSFSLRARQAFARTVSALPHEKAMLLTNHQQIVSDVDSLTRATVSARGLERQSA